jgi:methylated-DNA-[protein]-cysteine S-methyltransferase
MTMTTYYKEIESPVGKLNLVTSANALIAIHWSSEAANFLSVERQSVPGYHPILTEVERQLSEYFAGKRTEFKLPLEPRGTDFQKKVWNSLRTIPFGETKSYGEIASAIGSPRACRAVGAANGKNPLPIIIPCHRVIGASGALVGFAGGLEIKAKLLSLERQARNLPAKRIDTPSAANFASAGD